MVSVAFRNYAMIGILDPGVMKKLRVGDKIAVPYTEASAIKFEKVK